MSVQETLSLPQGVYKLAWLTLSITTTSIGTRMTLTMLLPFTFIALPFSYLTVLHDNPFSLY